MQIRVLALLLSVAAVTGCGASTPAREVGSAAPPSEKPSQADGPTDSGTHLREPRPADGWRVTAAAPADEIEPARPAWLGTRPLPLRPDGLGQILPTPPELIDRQFPPPANRLPDPPGSAPDFSATMQAVPDHVAARSTWHAGCPVALEDLRLATVLYWGFDGAPHTGEVLAHHDAIDTMVAMFRAAYDARFPIEEVRIIAPEEMDGPPTGDGNVTTAFVCRDSVGSGHWSQHAYGRAIDINPFHNPYARGDVVLPELASAYLDRGHRRPGMLHDDSAVIAVADQHGWGWGGRWESLVDWMHVSTTGR